MMKWELIESGLNGSWFKLSIEGGYIMRHVYDSGQYSQSESMVFIPNIVNNPIKVGITKEKVKK